MNQKVSSTLTQQEAEAKYADEAGNIVTKLDHLAEQSSNAWIESGRLVHSFVLKVTEDRTKRIDAHKILEKRSGAIYKSDMLRKLEGAFLLSEEMDKKGHKINVSMSHFFAVLHCDTNFDGKVNLLKAAAVKKSTVNDFKRDVAKNCPSKRPARKEAPVLTELEKTTAALIDTIGDCYSALSAFSMLRKDNPVAENVRSSLVNLVQLAIDQGLIDSANMNLHVQTADASDMRRVA